MLRTLLPRTIGLMLAALPPFAARAQSTTRDSAGVRIVQNARPSWPAGREWKLDAAPTIDVGSGEDSLYELATVMGAVRLSDGRIAIANMSTSNVRIYDTRGRYVLAMGRKGDGPGEFQQILGLKRLADDTLGVVDGREQMEFFTPDGRHVLAYSAPRPPRALVLSRLDVLNDGSYLRSSWPQGYDHPAGRWLDSLVVFAVTKANPDGGIISRHPAIEYVRSPNLSYPQAATFGPMGEITTAGDGYFAGFPDRYEIRHHRTDGRLDAIIRATWTPQPVRNADIARYKNFYVSQGAEGGGAIPPKLLAQRTQTMDEAVFARQLPAYSTMMVDVDRNLWVRESYLEWYFRQGFASVMPIPTSWRVFDKQGRWLGNVTMPARFNPMDIGKDYVLGLWRDEDDVEHVRMYRLAKPSA